MSHSLTNRVVKTEDEKYYYISNYNKIKNKVELEIYDKSSNKKIETERLLSNIPYNFSNKDTSNIYPLAITEIKENTYCNYEYSIFKGTSPLRWNIRRPQEFFLNWYYKDVYANTSNNIKYLNLFKKAVDEINILEGEMIMSALEAIMGVAQVAAAIVSGAIMAPAAVEGIVKSIGEGASFVSTFKSFNYQCSLAYKYFFLVK
nr:geobacillin-26 family protein [Helcococcus kunzii]